ncbi:MAG TPA: MqnA/MqnD/SBP family protein, partial [Pyrinomonadaceae bacterium]|nr:MqnA/MqnD/SBP family protein [Pyrinomonadaceae bacterium]
MNERRNDSRPRIAASSYLNTAPLIWSFLLGSQRDAVELFTDTAPARCAEMLARDEADAALVPVVEYHRIPNVAIIPDVCVGSRFAVRSVVLVTRRNNLKKVGRVA